MELEFQAQRARSFRHKARSSALLLLAVLAGFGATFATTAGAAGPIDLGMLPGTSESRAVAINRSGRVARNANNVFQEHGFFWSQAEGLVDLGTLGGLSTRGANALNDSGQVVGASATSSGACHAFLWTQSGGMRDLVTLGGSSSAVDVNASGQVAGTFLTVAGSHAFFWTKARGMVDVGVGRAEALNDHGQVVGESGGEPFSWTQAGG